MDAISPLKTSQPTIPTPPAATRQPQPDTTKAPVDSFTPSSPAPDPGIYKKQPNFTSTVKQKPDGDVDRKNGQISGAHGEIGTEAKVTAKDTIATGVTTKTEASGNLHADGSKQGSLSTQVNAGMADGSVRPHAEISGKVTAQTKGEQPSTYDATASASAGIEAKDGDSSVGVKFGATAKQGSNGSAASIDLGLNGQTRLGPVYVRGEAGIRGQEKDGGALRPEIFGKVQVGNPKLPVSVQASCSGDPGAGTPTCTAGLGGRF